MEQDYLMSNKTYDNLKTVVTLDFPLMAVLYAVIALVWDFEHVQAVVVMLAALALLGGILLKIVDGRRDKSEAEYDGEIITTGYDEDTGHPDLTLNIQVDPNTFIGKDVVRFKPVDQTK